MTDEAQAQQKARAAARQRAEGSTNYMLNERCVRGPDGPPMFPSVDASLVQIVQTRDLIVVIGEWGHQARLIPLDGRPHLTASIRAWAGDSRRRWSGDTLVVDTINFSGFGLPLAFDQNLHLIERFTRDGPDTLLYEFTVDDPTVWTKPWTVTVPMRKTNEIMSESACHEGNYGLTNMLRGPRFQEQSR